MDGIAATEVVVLEMAEGRTPEGSLHNENELLDTPSFFTALSAVNSQVLTALSTLESTNSSARHFIRVYGADGANGANGSNGANGLNGANGANGAYGIVTEMRLMAFMVCLTVVILVIVKVL